MPIINICICVSFIYDITLFSTVMIETFKIDPQESIPWGTENASIQELKFAFGRSASRLMEIAGKDYKNKALLIKRSKQNLN